MKYTYWSLGSCFIQSQEHLRGAEQKCLKKKSIRRGNCNENKETCSLLRCEATSALAFSPSEFRKGQVKNVVMEQLEKIGQPSCKGTGRRTCSRNLHTDDGGHGAGGKAFSDVTGNSIYLPMLRCPWQELQWALCYRDDLLAGARCGLLQHPSRGSTNSQHCAVLLVLELLSLEVSRN